MKKDKKWFVDKWTKERNKTDVHDPMYHFINEFIADVNQLDEPEVSQLDKKIRELETFNDELIRDNNQLRNAMDNQEVLSSDWIDENEIHITGNGADINGIYQYHNAPFVSVYDLQNLLLPQQKKTTVLEWFDEWCKERVWGDEIHEGGGATRRDIKHLIDIANGDNLHGLTGEQREYISRDFFKYLRALLDGYEVEKEQKYYVINEENELILGWSQSAYVTPCIEGYEYMKHNGRENLFQLTEQEIKDYDERYWPFAEKVEVTEYRLIF